MAKGHEGTANRLRRHWRKRIMARDYGACATGCIDAPYPEELLQVAHVTSAHEFRRAFGDELGTESSFRDDNLILLCEACHVVHTDMEFGRIRPLSQYLKPFLDKEEQRAIKTGEDLRDRRWFSKRRDLVTQLMEGITKKRGWTTVEDFSRIHGMPTPKPVPEPPKPTDSGDYPAGSNIPWANLPVGYSDVRKALLHVFRERHVEILAEGYAQDFIAYYESFEIQPYMFPGDTEAPTLLVQQPDAKPFMSAVWRVVGRSREAPPTLRSLKVGEGLYLLHMHSR